MEVLSLFLEKNLLAIPKAAGGSKRGIRRDIGIPLFQPPLYCSTERASLILSSVLCCSSVSEEEEGDGFDLGVGPDKQLID